jgi:hypothetical protein
MQHVVTFEDNGQVKQVTVTGPGKEELLGWAEAANRVYPEATLSWNTEELPRVGIYMNRGMDSEWIQYCTVEPAMEPPQCLLTYFAIDKNGKKVACHNIGMPTVGEIIKRHNQDLLRKNESFVRFATEALQEVLGLRLPDIAD